MDILFFDDMPLDSHNPEPRIKVRGLVRRGHRVAVVDKIGINDPSPANAGLILRRIGALVRPAGPGMSAVSSAPGDSDAAQVPHGGRTTAPWGSSLGTLRPVLVPPRRAPGVRTLNRWLLQRSVLSKLEETHLREPILWVRFPSPELMDILDEIPNSGVVYECVDDFPAFIHWSEATRERLREVERRLVQRADLLVVTSPKLEERLGPWARETVCVPNGVDLGLFNEGRPGAPLPADIEARLEGPVVGFVGALDLRLDYRLMVETARAVAPRTLLIVGPRSAGVDIGGLADVPNVVMAGPISHERVPDYVRRFDVSLLPYDTANVLVESVSPVKLYEYLAVGTPIVSTDIPAVRDLGGLVGVGGSHSDFVEEVRRALDDHDPDVRAARRRRAADESWERRLDELDATLRRVFRPGVATVPAPAGRTSRYRHQETLVSIVMPVYNVEAFVAQAVESVLGQTHSNLELIIVDDGSEDSSLEICRGYDDSRVRIVTQENRGLAGARNTGLRHVNGDLVALLDSDDLWVATKLEEHLRHLASRPEVGVSYCYSTFIDHQGSELGYIRRPKIHGVDAVDIFLRDPLHPSAPVMRREVLDDVAFPDDRHGASEAAYFDEDLLRCEDLEFWLRIALTTTWTFEGIGLPLSYLRINPGGLSSNLDEMMASWEQAVEKVRGYAPEFVAEWESLARAFQQRFLARRAVRNGEGLEALRLAVGAVRQDPTMLKLEPGTSAVTLLAALAQTFLPRRLYSGLERAGFRTAGGIQRHSD
jgi:glycosyltransferase involved in cell wall biosynthesis